MSIIAKRALLLIIGFLTGLLGSSFSGSHVQLAGAAQVSVPSAISAGYFLVATSTGAYIATTTDPVHAGSFFATSTNASSLPYASTTALSAAQLCLTGDVCRASWPSAGVPFEFTVNAYGNSTSSVIGFTNGLISVSSTTLVGNATTTGTMYMQMASSTYASSTMLTSGGGNFYIPPAGTITKIGGTAVSLTAAFWQLSNSGGDVWFQNNNSSANSGIAIKAGSSVNDAGSAVKFEAGGSERARITGNGGTGFGTTTPFGYFSVNAPFNWGANPLFVVASSTNTATTTFFSINSIGNTTMLFASTTAISATNASTTNLVVSSAGGTGTRCLQVGADGTVSANASACGTGTVTSVSGTWPILSTGGATPVISWGGLSTSSNAVQGNLLVFTDAAKSIGNVATTSPTFNGGLTTSGTAGAWVGGNAYTVSVANNGITVGMLAQAGANTFLGNSTGALGNVSAIATSSFFSQTTGLPTIPFASTTAISSVNSAFFGTTAGTLGLSVGSTTPWAYISLNPNGIGTIPEFVVGSSTATAFLIDNRGFVGDSTTTPWAQFSINPVATVNSTAPAFVVGSSTGTSLMVNSSGVVGVATATVSTTMWGLSIGTSTVIQGAQLAIGIASSSAAAAAYTADWDTGPGGNEFRVILNQNSSITLNATSSHPRDGGKYILKICQDTTGGRTLTWNDPGRVIWEGGNGATTTIASGASNLTMIGMIYDARVQKYDMVASSTKTADTRSCMP